MAARVVQTAQAEAGKPPSARGRRSKPTQKDFILARPSLKASDVVVEAAKHGMQISIQRVYKARSIPSSGDGKRRRGRPTNLALLGVPARGPHDRPGALPVDATLRTVVGRSLNEREMRLAAVVLEIGIDRVVELLDGLKQALARV